MTALRRLLLVGPVVLVAATVLPAAQPGGEGSQPPAPPKALAAVPRDGLFVVSVNVAELWDNPALKAVQEWFGAQKEPTLDALLGVGPSELERVTLYVPATSRDGDGAPVVLLTTRRPYNEARVLKNLVGPREANREFVRSGNVVRLRDLRPFGLAVLADERTLLLLPDGATDGGAAAAQLAAQVLGGKADGPLAPALAAAGASALSVGFDLRQVYRLVARDPGPNEFAPYAAAFRATSATLTADLGPDGLRARVALTYPTADNARRAGPVVEEGLADLAKLLDAEAARQGERGESGSLGAVVFGTGRDVLKAARVEVNGTAVVAAADGLKGDTIGQLVAALPKQVAAARRNAEAQNNLKQLLLGMHAYHDTYGFLPSDVGPDRKTAWGWRVQILPFVEQANLYNQLDLQKSWDDPRNRAILEKAEMPNVFEVPGRPAAKGHTYWRSFSLPRKAEPKGGRPWLVEGERGPSFASVTDGLSNTFAIVEAGEAVPWYMPDVLPYDGKLPLPPLGAKGGDGFVAGMGDGSVRLIRAKTDEATLRALITRDGGEVVALPAR